MKSAPSAFGEGNNSEPRSIWNIRKTTVKITNAAIAKTAPVKKRSRRVAPRTTSAPQPEQTRAPLETGVWQCGHASAFMARL